MKIKRNFNQNEQLNNNRNWKEKNKKYLMNLQKFLDSVNSVKDEELQKHIIGRMLKCDLVLTEIAEKEIERAKKNKKE